MINPLLLKTYCSLVENAHFTRTAERLNMTQSGVSQHVKKLEAQMGTALLSRKGKGFDLTDAGERLYSEAQKILLSLSNLEQSIVHDPPYQGTVKIMSPGSIGIKLYYHLLQLQVHHPKLIIDYRFAPNRDIEKAVANKSIDFGLLTEVPQEIAVDCKPIGRENLLLITPSTAPNPSWQQLETLGFVHHPDGIHHANLLLSANYANYSHIDRFEKKGFSNQISLILLPVSLGLGFTVLPEYAAENFHDLALISLNKLNNPVSETIYLCTHSTSSPPQRVNTVISEIGKHLTPSADNTH